jgi:hypothetical protein
MDRVSMDRVSMDMSGFLDTAQSGFSSDTFYTFTKTLDDYRSRVFYYITSCFHA